MSEAKHARNWEIWHRWQRGETQAALGRAYGITPKRIADILTKYDRWSRKPGFTPPPAKADQKSPAATVAVDGN